jgi:hypothetical protein
MTEEEIRAMTKEEISDKLQTLEVIRKDAEHKSLNASSNAGKKNGADTLRVTTQNIQKLKQAILEREESDPANLAISTVVPEANLEAEKAHQALPENHLEEVLKPNPEEVNQVDVSADNPADNLEKEAKEAAKEAEKEAAKEAEKEAAKEAEKTEEAPLPPSNLSTIEAQIAGHQALEERLVQLKDQISRCNDKIEELYQQISGQEADLELNQLNIDRLEARFEARPADKETHPGWMEELKGLKANIEDSKQALRLQIEEEEGVLDQHTKAAFETIDDIAAVRQNIILNQDAILRNFHTVSEEFLKETREYKKFLVARDEAYREKESKTKILDKMRLALEEKTTNALQEKEKWRAECTNKHTVLSEFWDSWAKTEKTLGKELKNSFETKREIHLMLSNLESELRTNTSHIDENLRALEIECEDALQKLNNAIALHETSCANLSSDTFKITTAKYHEAQQETLKMLDQKLNYVCEILVRLDASEDDQINIEKLIANAKKIFGVLIGLNPESMDFASEFSQLVKVLGSLDRLVANGGSEGTFDAAVVDITNDAANAGSEGIFDADGAHTVSGTMVEDVLENSTNEFYEIGCIGNFEELDMSVVGAPSVDPEMLGALGSHNGAE